MSEDTKAHRDNIEKLIQYLRDNRRTIIRDIIERQGGPSVRAGELKTMH